MWTSEEIVAVQQEVHSPETTGFALQGPMQPIEGNVVCHRILKKILASPILSTRRVSSGKNWRNVETIFLKKLYTLAFLDFMSSDNFFLIITIF